MNRRYLEVISTKNNLCDDTEVMWKTDWIWGKKSNHRKGITYFFRNFQFKSNDMVTLFVDFTLVYYSTKCKS